MANDEANVEDATKVMAYNPSTTHSLNKGARVLVAKDSQGFWVIIWAESSEAFIEEEE